MHRRWWILSIALLVYTAFMAWIGSFIFLVLGFAPDWRAAVAEVLSPAQWIKMLAAEEWWGLIGLPVIVLVATQMAFIAPIWNRGLRRSERGTSLRLSVAMAGVVAAALTLGLAFAAWNLVRFIQYKIGATSSLSYELDVSEEIVGWGTIGAVITSWIIWSTILLWFARRKSDHWVGTRLIGWLLGGTIAEVIVVLPLDIMVRRNNDCYCSTGTFFSLCLSAWALLWLAGPGAVIAVLSKRRRLWWETHCAKCGYEKGPSPGARCPECGSDWQVDARAKPQAANP